MRDYPPSHYEKAFQSWLTDNHIQYICVDDSTKAAFDSSKVKSFDFLLYPRSGKVVIAEVKGRKFKGTSLCNLTGLDSWVTADDVEGLVKWQQVFGPDHMAVFIFAYKMGQIDVDFDGHALYQFQTNRYVFFAVKADDYRKFMRLRSPKWQTVVLPAGDFRRCSSPIEDLLL
jgi:hypothetical protein